eukprot:gene6632-3290_t
MGGFRVHYLMQQADQRARPCYCPVCGQVNIKEARNNNMRCWSCNNNFCYLCHEWLRTKPGSHFGTGKTCGNCNSYFCWKCLQAHKEAVPKW